MMKPTCWIELRYGWGLHGLVIARSGNTELLHQVKAVTLAEAEKKVAMTKHMDSIMALIEQGELDKLRRILKILLPDERIVPYE